MVVDVILCLAVIVLGLYALRQDKLAVDRTKLVVETLKAHHVALGVHQEALTSVEKQIITVVAGSPYAERPTTWDRPHTKTKEGGN